MPAKTHDQFRLSDSPLSNQVASQGIGGQKTALMPNDEFDMVTPAGDQHFFSPPQRLSHRFFAQNRFGSTGCRSNSPGGMACVPGTNGNNI